MITIKAGCKGETVKSLQKALGIQTDGIFGKNTEISVKAFQKAHGLIIDGIVGPSTWKALGLQDTRCVDLSVIYNPLKTHITYSIDRPIKYIAIHFTAGAKSTKGSAYNIKNVFEKRLASADFAVDDETIVQINPDLDNYYCWSVGDKANTSQGGASLAGKAYNKNTISIEICSTLKKGYSAKHANTDGWYYTEEALAKARQLCRILMEKYNIPLDHVVRHYDISGKLCPGIRGWNDGKCYSDNGKLTGEQNNSQEWLKFKASI